MKSFKGNQIKNYLFSYLNIDFSELPFLLRFVIQNFFLGVFIGAFDIYVFSNFLNFYSARELPKVFIFSGLAGIVLFPLFAGLKIQTRFRFYSFYYYLVLISVLLIIGLLTLFFFSPVIFYAGVILAIPIGHLSFYLAQGIQGLYFTNDQSKRYKIFLDATYYLGVATVGFFVILYLLIRPEPDELLLFATGGVLVILLIQMNIGRGIKARYAAKQRMIAGRYESVNFKAIFKNRFLLLTILSCTILVVITTSINFSFYSLIQNNYETSIGYAKFLGLFFGTLSMFSLFFKYVLIKRILNSYDSPFNIFVIPVVILILVGLLLILDSLVKENLIISKYSLMFLFFVLLKIMDDVFRDSIYSPSLDILLRVNRITTYDLLKRLFKGTFYFAGLALSGVILFFVTKLSSHKEWVVAFLILFMCIAGLVSLFLLLKKFQSLLRIHINELSQSKKYFINKVIGLRHRLYKLNMLDSDDKMLYTLKLAENNYPADFRNNLYYLLGNSPEKIKEYAIGKIEEFSVLQYQDQIERQTKRLKNAYLKTRFKKLSDIFSTHIKKSNDFTNIYKLVDSRISDNRILAANMIGALQDKKLLSQLILLLKDYDPNVRKAAFIAATNFHANELTPIMIDHLSSTENYAYAYDVLVRIGDKCVEYLEKLFYEPKIDDRLLKRVVKLIGDFNSERAKLLLISKIDFSSPEVSRQATTSLVDSGYKPNEKSQYKILNIIIKIISSINQNLNFQVSLAKTEYSKAILNSIKKDIEYSFDQIYALLSLVHNRNIITKLRDYIEKEDLTSNHLALELIDNIIDSNIKSILIPTFQSSSILKKMKQLNHFFPIERATSSDIIDQILTSELGQISVWTKAVVLYSLIDNDDFELNDVVISFLFHKERILQETAACLLFNKDSDLYYETIERLDQQTKVFLENSVEFYKTFKRRLLINKVSFLKNLRYIGELRPTILTELAGYLTEDTMEADRLITYRGNPWTYPILFVAEGEIEVWFNNERFASFQKDSVLDFGLLHDEKISEVDIKTTATTSIFTVSREYLNIQIFDFPELEIVFQKIMNDFYASNRRKAS